MEWTPINEQLPDLDRDLLVTVEFNNNGYREVTDSVFEIQCNSDGNPTFSMGSAHDFKIFAWMYSPEVYTGDECIHYEYKWNEKRCANDVKRTTCISEYEPS